MSKARSNYSFANLLFGLVNPVVNIGTNGIEDSSVRLSVQLINIVAAGAVLVTFFCLLGLSVVEPYQVYIAQVPIGLIGVAALYLNTKGMYKIAAVVAVIGTTSMQFTHHLFIEDFNSGIEWTFIGVTLICPIVFDKIWMRVGSIFLLSTYFIVILHSRGYEISDTHSYLILLVVFAMLIVMFVFYNYIQESTRELKNKNKQLIKQNTAQEELIIKNNLKTELLGILSHDLKGPAAAFNQLSQKVSFLLKNKRYKEIEEFGAYFEMAGDKIYKDIDRLLNWTIAQKEKIIIRESQFVPYDLVERIIDHLQHQIKDRSEIFDNLISKELQLTTDNHLLEIILKNLLINAANHTPEDERVTINAIESTSQLVIQISNGGVPIDMTIVDQAQAGRYQKSDNGHGLGLGICFSLIKFLKGDIIFERNKGVGTMVSVALPKE